MLAFMGSEHVECPHDLTRGFFSSSSKRRVVSTSFNCYGHIAKSVEVNFDQSSVSSRRLSRCRFLPLPIMKDF